jgi:hypothetical protein
VNQFHFQKDIGSILVEALLTPMGQPVKVNGKLMVIQFHFQKHLHSTLVGVLLTPKRQMPKPMESQCLTEDPDLVFWCQLILTSTKT